MLLCTRSGSESDGPSMLERLPVRVVEQPDGQAIGPRSMNRSKLVKDALEKVQFGFGIGIVHERVVEKFGVARVDKGVGEVKLLRPRNDEWNDGQVDKCCARSSWSKWWKSTALENVGVGVDR